MIDRLNIDGEDKRISLTRVVHGWLFFYVLDAHGRKAAEHSAPMWWMETQVGTVLCSDHVYQRATPH